MWARLNELERMISAPYMCGLALSSPDITWFPSCIFMEFMLPRVFGWANFLREAEGPLPRLAAWYAEMLRVPACARWHEVAWALWSKRWEGGVFFTEIIAETRDPAFKWRYP